MYKKQIEFVLREVSSREEGLKNEEVKNRNQKKNELVSPKKESYFQKFVKEFKDPLVIILLLAATISLIVEPSDWIESIIILIVVLINATLGVIQESKAEKSLEALKKMTTPRTKVLRDNEIIEINSSDVVVGDILVLEAGDYVPADARIIRCTNLKVDESSLTGESEPSTKISSVINKEDLPIADQKNMLFSSTYITEGTAKAVTIKIGMDTEIGKLASILGETSSQKTPLQQKLDEVGKVIGILSIIICIIVFGLELLTTKQDGHYYILESFKTAVALAVAAVPEGLATVVTITLAIGVNKMAKQNAIIKKMPAVETLGSANIICSDKTGTLTINRMTVKKIYNQRIKEVDDIDLNDRELISYFAICCSARETINGYIGDPTEIALLELNKKINQAFEFPEIIKEYPFDSDRKMMSVLIKKENEYLQITKGAPDIILKNANLTNEEKEKIIQANDKMAVDALRVLGLGIKKYQELPTLLEETNLSFMGLVGMIDPPRVEVKAAIEKAKKAGLSTIMITGDQLPTAIAIGKELNIISNQSEAINAIELSKLTDDELFEKIEQFKVYARVSPFDKVRIVKAWQKKNMVVAMTGDGVNDAPALKCADIGCAMEITGTEVAKQAADMVLVDDNYTTIISAVEEGRNIYHNIKNVISYLISSNIGEICTILFASIICIFGKELGVPLSPIHLLWINLITDTLPSIGLGMEKSNDDIMNKPPRDKNEKIFNKELITKIVFEGILIGTFTLIAYIIGEQIDHSTGQTMAFLTLSSAQLFHAYNVKTNKKILSKGLFNNKTLNISFLIGFIMQGLVIYLPSVNNIFKLSTLDISEVLICLGLSFIFILITNVFRLINKRK